MHPRVVHSHLHSLEIVDQGPHMDHLHRKIGEMCSDKAADYIFGVANSSPLSIFSSLILASNV